mgnify:CR=1 FL=1
MSPPPDERDVDAGAPPLAFTKMHGLGNDFMVVDNTAGTLVLDAARIRRLADRHTGVGFDQLLVVEPAARPEAAFLYRIFNADGGEVEHCGNGARCFARFVHERSLTDAREIVVDTSGGPVTLRLREDGQVTVDMGVPTFEPARIPFVAETAAEDGRHALDVDGERLLVGVAGLGNPHVVVSVDDVAAAPVDRLGPALERHPRFPNRVNVGFAEIVDRGHLRLRVFERGVGETRACGTGACAAVAVGQRQGRLDRRVRVTLSGGELDIHRPDDRSPIEMTGPCSTVFEGQTRM